MDSAKLHRQKDSISVLKPNFSKNPLSQGASFNSARAEGAGRRATPTRGPFQTPLVTMAIVMGLRVRVGMEDNVFYRRGELAKSNAQLVERVVRIANEVGRPVATSEGTRRIVGLPKGPAYMERSA